MEQQNAQQQTGGATVDAGQVRQAQARADEAAWQAVEAARQATAGLEETGQQWTREDLEATRQLERLTARHATIQMEAREKRRAQAVEPEPPEAGQARRNASRNAVQKARARAEKRNQTANAMRQHARKGKKAVLKNGATGARRSKKDPLRYVANLVALAALAYLVLYALLRLGVGRLFVLFHENATLDNPLAVPEWALGLVNLVLPAVCLLIPFLMLRTAVAKGPMALKISLKSPYKPALWAFLPVVLGISLAGNMLSAALQNVLYETTQYRPPEVMRLPQNGFATFLYFLGICAVPAVLEELLVRGAIQQLLSRWGAWFSIVVSSVVFTLLHGDIAQMPALFILSVLMGLSAHCTGTLSLGMALHFANNTMSFCFLYATQKMDGVSAVALTGYLMLGFLVAAALCATYIHRNRVFSLLRPIPRVYDPKNRQSRAERLATTPLLVLVLLGLLIRALAPVFVDLGGMVL